MEFRIMKKVKYTVHLIGQIESYNLGAFFFF